MTRPRDPRQDPDPADDPRNAHLFDLRRFLQSFGHAGRGLQWALASQTNLRVHWLAAVAVLVAAAWLGFSVLEFAVVVVCIAVVLAAELFNTAIEGLIDHAWPEQSQAAGRAKDVAAAAVLVTSLGAAVVGVLLFGRHILINF